LKLLTGARYIADWRLTMKKKAIAHANIALVKYWGKRNASLNIPAVGSISVTLKDLFTITSVEFRKELEKDILILNGKRAKTGQEKRVSKFLDLFREEAGIKTFADVVSENNFPMGAGLASSASGFGALVVAASQAANLQHSPAELSELARRGSGSAARSIFGGFVEMKTGKKADGSDARAVTYRILKSKRIPRCSAAGLFMLQNAIIGLILKILARNSTNLRYVVSIYFPASQLTD